VRRGAAGLRRAIPRVGSGFLTDGTLEAQGAAAQGLVTTLHYGDEPKNPRNETFRNRFAVTYKAKPDVCAMQGYDAAQLLAAGVAAVKGDAKQKDALVAAMGKAQIDSPRGKFTFSPQPNPTQDFCVLEVKGNDNVVTGVAVKALADPGRGCKML
jgi:branched-chain amino acid transport system substrate-binding protein